jgi:hypothetical protein
MRDTIDMAREAGLSPVDYPTTEKLKAFEALVRADERAAQRNPNTTQLNRVKVIV